MATVRLPGTHSYGSETAAVVYTTDTAQETWILSTEERAGLLRPEGPLNDLDRPLCAIITRERAGAELSLILYEEHMPVALIQWFFDQVRRSSEVRSSRDAKVEEASTYSFWEMLDDDA